MEWPNGLGQVVHTRSSVTKQYNLVPFKGQWCPAAGEVTVGLASHWPRVRLQWFIHLRAHSLRKGDQHTAYTPHGVWHSFFTSICARMHVRHRQRHCPTSLPLTTSFNLVHWRLDLIMLPASNVPNIGWILNLNDSSCMLCHFWQLTTKCSFRCIHTVDC